MTAMDRDKQICGHLRLLRKNPGSIETHRLVFSTSILCVYHSENEQVTIARYVASKESAQSTLFIFVILLIELCIIPLAYYLVCPTLSK